MMKNKNRKKGFVSIAVIVGVIIVAFSAIIITVPVARGAILGAIGIHEQCDVAPFDPNCECKLDQEKIPSGGIFPQFFCENLAKFIDPADPNSQMLSISHVESELQTLFPSCDMATCSHPQATPEWVTGPGIKFGQDEIERTILVECRDRTTGFIFATVVFDVEDGSIERASCGSYNDVVDPTTSQNPATLQVTRTGSSIQTGRINWRMTIDSGCGTRDNGIAVTTLDVPDMEKVNNWHIESTMGPEQWCTLSDITTNSVKLKCDTQCPHASFGGLPFLVVADYTPEFLQSIRNCQISGESRFWTEGNQVVCNAQKTAYVCELDGTWSQLTGSWTTSSTSYCP